LRRTHAVDENDDRFEESDARALEHFGRHERPAEEEDAGGEVAADIINNDG
jgi:hypothetical protein